MGYELQAHYARLDLQFGGGCEEHDFAVWWTGIAAPSNPPVIPLELQHYDHGDTCDALLSRSIWIDLTEIGDGRALVEFVMQRGSVIRIDYPGGVTPTPPPASDVLAIDRSCGVIDA
jgi:hypothetical protein